MQRGIAVKARSAIMWLASRQVAASGQVAGVTAGGGLTAVGRHHGGWPASRRRPGAGAFGPSNTSRGTVGSSRQRNRGVDRAVRIVGRVPREVRVSAGGLKIAVPASRSQNPGWSPPGWPGQWVSGSWRMPGGSAPVDTVVMPGHQRDGTGPDARGPGAGGPVELVGDLDRPGAWMLLAGGVPQSHVDLDDPLHLELEYMRAAGAPDRPGGAGRRAAPRAASGRRWPDAGPLRGSDPARLAPAGGRGRAGGGQARPAAAAADSGSSPDPGRSPTHAPSRPPSRRRRCSRNAGG